MGVKFLPHLIIIISHLSLNHEGRWGTTVYHFATSFLHFPLFSTPLGLGERTAGLSIPWCCLPTSSSVYLVFFPLLLCLARWFWLDLMNVRHDHTTAVFRLQGQHRSDFPKRCSLANRLESSGLSRWPSSFLFRDTANLYMPRRTSGMYRAAKCTSDPVSRVCSRHKNSIIALFSWRKPA